MVSLESLIANNGRRLIPNRIKPARWPMAGPCLAALMVSLHGLSSAAPSRTESAHDGPEHRRPGTPAASAPPATRSIVDAIGSTPLLDLPRLARHCGLPEGTRLLAKAEHLNPGGSSKDRLAVALVDAAERRGL